MSIDWNETPPVCGEGDFENLLAVLRCEKPRRPTLFEFYMNGPLYARLARVAGESLPEGPMPLKVVINAFRNAGYDYYTCLVPGFSFPSADKEEKASFSLNATSVIRDRASFKAYPWPDPEAGDYGVLDELARLLPPGMKLIAFGPDGVAENAVRLVGFDNLCFLMADDPDLVTEVFGAIGMRLARYYEICAAHPAVGACISNDDWGYRSRTFFSIEAMRRWVFPWHRKIVEAVHAAGKPVILHSCGNLEAVMDIVIDELKFDGKHSFEDAIEPVEEAYERYQGRIAVLGGIDVDFICRSAPAAVHARSRAMLEHAARRGGYALGTGNSVPEYVPDAGYFAMIRAALDVRRRAFGRTAPCIRRRT